MGIAGDLASASTGGRAAYNVLWASIKITIMAAVKMCRKVGTHGRRRSSLY